MHGEPGGHDQYVNGDWLAKNPDWGEQDAVWKATQVSKLLGDHGLRPASICDVGCGTGGVLDALGDLLPGAPELIGYEISPDALALASEERHRRVTLVNAPISEATREFDVVMALDVFEHVPDYLGFLEELRTHGRYFVFHIPLDMNVKLVLKGGPLRARAALGHLHYFTRETALATLTDSGYRILDERFTRPSIELAGRAGVSRALRLPRIIGMKLSPVMTARLAGGFPLLVLAEPA